MTVLFLTLTPLTSPRVISGASIVALMPPALLEKAHQHRHSGYQQEVLTEWQNQYWLQRCVEHIA